MSKRCRQLCFIVSVVLLCGSCGKQPLSDDAAEAIIHDFRQGNYEYTRTSFHQIDGAPQVIDEEVEGKLISDPYEQYEQVVSDSEAQGITEQYWYTQDGKIMHNIKMTMGDTPDQ